MTNKHIVDQAKKVGPNFQILLFGLEREKTTSIFLGEIENNTIVPVMKLHILSLIIVRIYFWNKSFHLGVEQNLKCSFSNLKECPPSISTSKSSLLETTSTSPSLYSTSYALEAEICLAKKRVTFHYSLLTNKHRRTTRCTCIDT